MQTAGRLLLLSLISAAAVAVAHDAHNASGLATGKVDLKSAGPLAFGPDGVLFVGDSLDASIVAIQTGEKGGAKSQPSEIKAVNEKIAALLGTTADQILINDAVVNPKSGRVYMSVSRGRGPDALPVILRADASGNIEELKLDNVPHAKAALPDAPQAGAKDGRGRDLRVDSITNVEYVDGQVIVAGLSNEEFSSKLRSISYPFAKVEAGTSVEMYHGSHGRYETNSPIRTFVSYNIDGKPYILAAYTCTPLVKFQLSDLTPGNKVMGTTIAELGNMNRPLDMIVYKKGSSDHILMNNSSRGVMKMSTDGISKLEGITARISDKAGLAYETLGELKGVQQLDRWNDTNAMLLVKNDSGSMDIRALALP
jgi:hypothetical protein